MISAVILTKNEQKNIEECLKTLNWCNEIIVLDDYSSDRTVEIAIKMRARVVKRHLSADFGAQRNAALKEAKGDWVLFVDADERVSKELVREIQRNMADSQTAGFLIKRKDNVFGQWLNHGEPGRMKLLRLARRDSGLWTGKVHEVWSISGVVHPLENPLLHYPHKNVAHFLVAINEYSTLRADELYRMGKKTNALEILSYPVAKFCQDFFLFFGFLDGMAGFIHAILMSLHSFLVRGKLWLLWKKHSPR